MKQSVQPVPFGALCWYSIWVSDSCSEHASLPESDTGSVKKEKEKKNRKKDRESSNGGNTGNNEIDAPDVVVSVPVYLISEWAGVGC